MEKDVLSLDDLRKELGNEPIALRVFDCVDSTNEEAKRMAIDGERRTVLIAAAQQTRGRGRLGRSFYSPASTGIYFSVLHTVDRPLQSAVSLTGAAAVAVMRAIRTKTGKDPSIKWVNDLYLDGKKVCGILAEALSGLEEGRRHLILGIGINLRTDEFPMELSDKAGSVYGIYATRAALIAEIYRELKPFLQDSENRTWIEDYRAHSAVLGKRIVWTEGEHSREGRAVGINDFGELEVETDQNERLVLRTGEISVCVQDS